MVVSNQSCDYKDTSPEGWHLKKEVNLSIIFALATLALTGFWGFADLKKDVELLKLGQQVLKESDIEQVQMRKDTNAILRIQLAAMDVKLDRLIERQLDYTTKLEKKSQK